MYRYGGLPAEQLTAAREMQQLARELTKLLAALCFSTPRCALHSRSLLDPAAVPIRQVGRAKQLGHLVRGRVDGKACAKACERGGSDILCLVRGLLRCCGSIEAPVTRLHARGLAQPHVLAGSGLETALILHQCCCIEPAPSNITAELWDELISSR